MKLLWLSHVLVLGFAVICVGCAAPTFPTFGKIVRLDPRMDALVPPGAAIEKLASGFEWTEGPVWVPEGDHLLFSDIPNNVIHKWKEGEGVTIFLRPAGYTGDEIRGEELGTNGLVLDPQGRLVLCEHGNRRVTRLAKFGQKEVLASRYEGKRLNSPNDAVFRTNGDLYFTDPPYGLVNRWDDPARELDFCGVYRRAADGTLTLLTRDMSRPNGLAFSPNEKTFYVANSDPDKAIWMRFDVAADGTIENGRLFHDATQAAKDGLPGLPDGMTVDSDGNVFATGPGGVYVFTADGDLLGRIDTGQRTANCTFGDNGKTLYMTAHMFLARIRLNTKGQGF